MARGKRKKTQRLIECIDTFSRFLGGVASVFVASPLRTLWEFRSVAHDAWIDAGGCAKCGGTKWDPKIDKLCRGAHVRVGFDPTLSSVELIDQAVKARDQLAREQWQAEERERAARQQQEYRRQREEMILRATGGFLAPVGGEETRTYDANVEDLEFALSRSRPREALLPNPERVIPVAPHREPPRPNREITPDSDDDL